MISRRAKRVAIGTFILVFSIVFILVSVGRYVESARELRRYEEERAAIQAPPINIHTVETRNMPQMRRYSAELRPWMAADVPAEIPGRVTETLVEPGLPVREGDPLVRLDARFASLVVEQAAAQYEESERLRQEAEQLVRTNAVSRTQFDAAAAEARRSRAALEEAKERLARHTVRSPFDGIVNERYVDIGEAVSANEAVASVVDLSRLRVVFYVSEEELEAFQPGRQLDLQVQARPGLSLEPSIDFVSRSADPRTRLFRVEAVLDNAGSDLPGGLQGVVEAEIARFADLPFIPAAGVRFAGRSATVLRPAANLDEDPVPVTVQLGPEIDGFYPVLDGLAAGDRILIR